MDSRLKIYVACAIIENNDKVLVVQRSALMSMPLKWEFPGGKLEANESLSECIKREINEELQIKIEVISFLDHHHYSYEKFDIVLMPVVAKSDKINIELTEHNDYIWSIPTDLYLFDWAEADLGVVDLYNKYLETQEKLP
jgi:8-oxo-dGTP diphosphatase